MRAGVRQVSAWLIAAGIVAALLVMTDLDEVARSFLGADLLTFVATLAGFCLLFFLLDSVIWTVLFNRLLGKMGFRDVLTIRSLSYYLDIINHGAAVAGAAYMVHRLGRFRLAAAASTVLWLMVLDVSVLLLMTAGWLLASEPLPEVISVAMPWVLLVGWTAVLGVGLYWHAGVDFFFLGRLRRWRIFEAFRRASLRDVAVVGALRLVFLVTYVAFDRAALMPFGIHIDFGTMLLYSPVIALAEQVPGTFSGLGAVQPVFIVLYGAHADPALGDPSAQVFAFSTALGVTVTALRLVISFAFTGAAARAMSRSAPTR